MLSMLFLRSSAWQTLQINFKFTSWRYAAGLVGYMESAWCSAKQQIPGIRSPSTVQSWLSEQKTHSGTNTKTCYIRTKPESKEYTHGIIQTGLQLISMPYAFKGISDRYFNDQHRCTTLRCKPQTVAFHKAIHHLGGFEIKPSPKIIKDWVYFLLLA